MHEGIEEDVVSRAEISKMEIAARLYCDADVTPTIGASSSSRLLPLFPPQIPFGLTPGPREFLLLHCIHILGYTSNVV